MEGMYTDRSTGLAGDAGAAPEQTLVCVWTFDTGVSQNDETLGMRRNAIM